MGSESENCLTCGHTEDSHFFDEEPYTSKKGGPNNYCKVKDCDCEQFRI
jgi:hypothetical protein